MTGTADEPQTRVDFDERVPAANYADQVYLNGTSEGLEMTTVRSDEQVTVVLSSYGVRELRLALARYESAVKRAESQR